MNKVAFTEIWKSFLGARLVSAKRRLYETEGVAVSQLDLAEVVLSFDALDSTRYFSWEQAGDEFELSVRSESHFVKEYFPEIAAIDDAILSKSLGKRHTLFELYENEVGSVVAVSLYFENKSFAIAVGYDEWNEDMQKANLKDFFGNDVFLWTTEEFVEALRNHKLNVAARIKA